MKTERKTAVIVGVLFIAATAASLLGNALTGSILAAPDYLVGVAASSNRVIIGALLTFLAAAGSSGIALALYPVLKKQNEGLAIGAVGFRLFERNLQIVSGEWRVKNATATKPIKEQIMETMKAAICTKYGPPEVLKIAQHPKPVPKEDEILIKICATSVTNSDLFIRSSKVALRLLIPFRLMIGIRKPRKAIIGEVFSGIVTQVGSKIRRFRVGDQLYGLTGFSLGAYAEYKCMKAVDSKQGCVAIKPQNISFEEATSAAYGGLLAFQFLEPANIQPHQKVLIYGASGTSGTIALQLAKTLQAEVTGVCGPSHIPFIQALGADKTLDYTKDSEIGNLASYDIVLDCVGKARSSPLKEACQKALTAKGKYLSIDDAALLLDSSRLDRIRDLIERGQIKPINDRCYALDQIIEAHYYVELGHKQGNVAITVSQAT